jgi:folate-binding Fe-S cluster repair protein YgfZ
MLHLDGSAVVFPAPGTPVENNGVQVGFLGTVARHHELGPIALALIKRSTPIDAVLTVDGISAAQEVIVSGSR